VAGNIALISRGTCTFATKSLNAKAAGAVGIVIYNNVDGLLQGTLGGPGDYAPTVGISKADGQAFLTKIAGGTTVTADLNVVLTNVTTYVSPCSNPAKDES
jgi:carboxypeptidase Q